MGGVLGGFELEGGVFDVEVADQARLQLVYPDQGNGQDGAEVRVAWRERVRHPLRPDRSGCR